MITIEHLYKWFERFNKRYFKGTLPIPLLELSRTKTALGDYSYKQYRMKWGKTLCQHRIRLSLYYEQSERELQNILLHEMIHYYIQYNGIEDSGPHGKRFRELMEWLNSKHGWEISITAEAKTPEERGEGRYIVLVLELKGQGRAFAVVNPGFVKPLSEAISRDSNILWHQWYQSRDPYFNTFPKRRSLRLFLLSEQRWSTMQPKMEALD